MIDYQLYYSKVNLVLCNIVLDQKVQSVLVKVAKGLLELLLRDGYSAAALVLMISIDSPAGVSQVQGPWIYFQPCHVLASSQFTTIS